MRTMRRDHKDDGPAMRRSASIHAAAAAFACAGAVGGITAFAVAQEREPKRSDRAIEVEAAPTPPRFEAHVLERVRPPRPRFDDDSYFPRVLADDGTVYGTVEDKIRQHDFAFISRVGEGTTWLLPNEPKDVEVRPIAASTSDVVLLFAFGYWPSEYVLVPDRGVREMNSLHPDFFFPFDMNNAHVFAGQTGIDPRRAVVFLPRGEFEHLAPAPSAALKINQQSSVIGWIDSTEEDITFRVWHADGRESNFVVRRRVIVDVDDINNHDEVVGHGFREDPNGRVRMAGWFWSERTGVVEIPFRFDRGDVEIMGISDDGWVYGSDSPLGGRRYFLWHVDAGFHDLGDLYDWEDRFRAPANGTWGAVNGPGQIVIRVYSLKEDRLLMALLDRVD